MNDRERKAVVKALEWESENAGAMPFARVPQWGECGHKYQVSKDTRCVGYKAYLAPTYGSWFWVSGGHDTIDEAKSAAQSDYEDRIRSSLIGGAA